MTEKRPRTKEELATLVTDVTDEDVLLWVSRISKETLVVAGAGVGTPRLVTDGVRIYDILWNYLPTATEEQLEALDPVSPTLLQAAIYAMVRADGLYDELQAAKKNRQDVKAADVKAAEVARAVLLKQRNGLIRKITTVAAGDEVLLTELRTAIGSVATPPDLTTSINDLTALAERLIDDPDADMKARVSATRLAKPKLTAMREDALKHEVLADKAGVPFTGVTVKQSEVDFWDGVGLHLFVQVVDAANAAHDLDPSIPNPPPISLRTWYRSRPRHKKAEPAPANPPVGVVTGTT